MRERVFIPDDVDEGPPPVEGEGGWEEHELLDEEVEENVVVPHVEEEVIEPPIADPLVQAEDIPLLLLEEMLAPVQPPGDTIIDTTLLPAPPSLKNTSQILILGSLSQPQLRLMGFLLVLLLLQMCLISVCWWYYSGYISYLYERRPVVPRKRVHKKRAVSSHPPFVKEETEESVKEEEADVDEEELPTLLEIPKAPPLPPSSSPEIDIPPLIPPSTEPSPQQQHGEEEEDLLACLAYIEALD